MKNYHIIILSLCILLSSCSLNITYFGDKLPPTTSVDIYYSAHDVTKQYKVIGHLTCPNTLSQDKIKAQLAAYAMKIGADAVVITGSTGNDSGKFSEAIKADALKYTN
jgi:hypothetical protein